MTITLSWPIIAIIIFVIATQIWAWTREYPGLLVFTATLLDMFFIALVGGLWIW